MKQIYFKTILFLTLILSSATYAQTYTIDSNDQLSTCNRTDSSQMDATYVGAFYTSEAYIAYGIDPVAQLGSFTDTNAAGATLTSLSVKAFSFAQDSEYDLYLNGVLVGKGLSSHTLIEGNEGFATCQNSIADDVKVTADVTITLTPEAIAAYKTGEVNELTTIVTTDNFVGISFYGFEVTAEVSASLSVKDVEFASVNLYPNPSKDLITITGLKNTEDYTIYNVLGTKMASGTISENESINVENFSKGIYLLTFKNRNTFKIVKE